MVSEGNRGGMCVDIALRSVRDVSRKNIIAPEIPKGFQALLLLICGLLSLEFAY